MHCILSRLSYASVFIFQLCNEVNSLADFVIYLGDVVTANNVLIANASLYWDEATSPTRSRGIPWASVLGIPQLRCPLASIRNLGEQDCSFTGHTSCGAHENRDGEEHVISKAQADWFKHKSQKLNPDFRVPEIIFWHIASKAYKKVAPMFMKFSSCVGSINNESVCSQEAEMGIIQITEKRPSVKAIFIGHDHGLDWCCPYKKNFWLCYARHTGYGGYGNWARGSRILEIKSHPFSLKTWIRMEDGSSHSELILSS